MKINFDKKKLAEVTADFAQKTAYAIDSAIGDGNVSLSSQAEKEHYSKLIFNIEF